MVRDISTLTTGETAKILGVTRPIVRRWIDRGRLKGVQLPGSKDKRVYLPELIRFMAEYKFPRAPFLVFAENNRNGTTKDELKFYRITEPVGRKNVRFYPDEYSVLGNGEISTLVNLCETSTNRWMDNTELGYRPPFNGGHRRMTADDFLRAHLRYRKKMSIPYGLETKTSLLINHPGKWKESQRIMNNSDSNKSIWYRDDGIVQESSIRLKDDGLYIKLKNKLCYFILLGITERKEFGKVVHPYHLNRIFTYLQQGISLLNCTNKKNRVKQAKTFLEYSEKQLDSYIINKN